MTELGIGLIGSGFMGRSHTLALRAAAGIFPLPLNPRFELLAEAEAALAARQATALGYARSTADWQALVADPRVDAVHITTPNKLHFPMAMAVIEAGKAVHCEKPLALSAADAFRLADAAEAAGVTTIVGFNYLKNPIQGLARELIQSGEIGEPVGFRGIHAEDYMTSPEARFSFRHEPEGGGVAMDLGSHVVSLARLLLGDIARVTAKARTVHPVRLDREGRERAVTVDDQIDMLVEFGSGVTGSIQASWVAAGQSMQLGYEVVCSRGSIVFDQGRLNELRLFKTGGADRTAGFTTINAGPAHDPYGAFCPAPGHQLGFNDMKTVEMRDFMLAIAGQGSAAPDFREAARIQAVIDAALASAGNGEWVAIPGT